MLAFYMMLIDDEQNKSKFEQLYYEYRDRMMYVALSVLHNNEDAEDAVHNAFIGIAKNMDSIGEVASVQTLSYVLKATKNTAINMLGKNKRYETVDIENFDVVSDDDFFASLDIKERYNEVVKAIVNLDEKYKDVLFYHYVSDMPVSKVAEILGRKVSTVKQQLVRGKKLLIESLGANENDE